jgi:HlyD family secretion protein
MRPIPTLRTSGAAKARLLLILVLAAAAGAAAWHVKHGAESDWPVGIVSGNGRIEADQVDIAAKYAGRIQDVLVQEGDNVSKGQVLARLDTTEIKTHLAQAKAQQATAEEAVVESQAVITQRASQLKLAEQELARARPLVERGSLSKRTLEQRESQRDSAQAALQAAKAHLKTMQSSVVASMAGVSQIEAKIDECVLKSPAQGRVLYRLAEPGEVLGAGGKVLTILDLTDISMEIFLGSTNASRLAIGSEARITIDAASTEFAIPALVSFVSPEAQFTPKQVETLQERQKLMFRVKLRIPQELVLRHLDKVKTGVRGMGYVRTDDTVPWPEALEKRYPGDPQ